MTVFLVYYGGAMTLAAAAMAAGVVFFALERDRDRALVDSQRQELTLCRAELADCRDLLVGDVEQALSPRIED